MFSLTLGAPRGPFFYGRLAKSIQPPPHHHPEIQQHEQSAPLHIRSTSKPGRVRWQNTVFQIAGLHQIFKESKTVSPARTLSSDAKDEDGQAGTQN